MDSKLGNVLVSGNHYLGFFKKMKTYEQKIILKTMIICIALMGCGKESSVFGATTNSTNLSQRVSIQTLVNEENKDDFYKTYKGKNLKITGGFFVGRLAPDRTSSEYILRIASFPNKGVADIACSYPESLDLEAKKLAVGTPVTVTGVFSPSNAPDTPGGIEIFHVIQVDNCAF